MIVCAFCLAKMAFWLHCYPELYFMKVKKVSFRVRNQWTTCTYCYFRRSPGKDVLQDCSLHFIITHDCGSIHNDVSVPDVFKEGNPPLHHHHHHPHHNLLVNCVLHVVILWLFTCMFYFGITFFVCQFYFPSPPPCTGSSVLQWFSLCFTIPLSFSSMHLVFFTIMARMKSPFLGRSISSLT